MILGLDISTSIIGITILNKDGNIIHTEALDLRNKNHYPDVYKKYERVYAYFLELKLDYNYNFTHIFIEQSLQMFRSGFSSAKTLSTLSSFNGVERTKEETRAPFSRFCSQILWHFYPQRAKGKRSGCSVFA
jgi:hypothetical protein